MSALRKRKIDCLASPTKKSRPGSTGTVAQPFGPSSFGVCSSCVVASRFLSSCDPASRCTISTCSGSVSWNSSTMMTGQASCKRRRTEVLSRNRFRARTSRSWKSREPSERRRSASTSTQSCTLAASVSVTAAPTSLMSMRRAFSASAKALMTWGLSRPTPFHADARPAAERNGVSLRISSTAIGSVASSSSSRAAVVLPSRHAVRGSPIGHRPRSFSASRRAVTTSRPSMRGSGRTCSGWSTNLSHDPDMALAVS